MEDGAVAGDVVLWGAGCVGPDPGLEGASRRERNVGIAMVVVVSEGVGAFGGVWGFGGVEGFGGVWGHGKDVLELGHVLLFCTGSGRGALCHADATRPASFFSCFGYAVLHW